MKSDVANFVARCMTCQRVKAEHQKPEGQFHPLPIPEWKWDDAAMDFVSRLPKAQGGQDIIWVIMDRLTKPAHFLLIRNNQNVESLG